MNHTPIGSYIAVFIFILILGCSHDSKKTIERLFSEKNYKAPDQAFPRLWGEGKLLFGLKNGFWKFYTPPHQLKLKGNYFLGKKHGKWTLINNDSLVFAILIYNQDSIESITEFFPENESKAKRLEASSATFNESGNLIAYTGNVKIIFKNEDTLSCEKIIRNQFFHDSLMIPGKYIYRGEMGHFTGERAEVSRNFKNFTLYNLTGEYYPPESNEKK